MSKLNLMLHCGSKAVSRDELFDIDTPEETKSHKPIAHGELLTRVENVVRSKNLSVISEAHGVNRNGSQYFGMLQIDRPDISSEYDMVIGLRNSHDKSIAAGLALGSGTFVCDNLAFSSDVVLSRKHTSKVMDDLDSLIEKAFNMLSDEYTNQDNRFNVYKAISFSKEESSDFILDLFMNDVISSRSIKDLTNEWRNPQHNVFRERNLYNMFNCTTEVLKGCVPESLLRRTQLLYQSCDRRADFGRMLG